MKNSRTLNCGPIARLGSLVLACALLSPAVARAQQSSSAVRIHRLEDIEEIRTVLTDYGRYLDAHDLVAYSHLFASDGEWVGGFGTGKGPTGIQTLMERNLGVTAKAKPGSTYHLLTMPRSRAASRSAASRSA